MPIYDVENRFSYYKSYSDNIMSGSALPTLGSSTWDRGVIGSVVSGSEEYKGATLLSDYLFKISGSFFRSGETRYLRLSSQKQSIQDSYVPDIIGIYLTGSYGAGKFVWGLGGPNDIDLLIAFDGKAITGSNNQRVNNIEWVSSFPYEKKYYKIPADNQVTRLIVTASFRYDPALENIYVAESKSLIFDKAKVFINITYVKTSDPYRKQLIYNYDNIGYYDAATGNFVSVEMGVSGGGNKRSLYSYFFGINPKVMKSDSALPVGLNTNYESTGSVGFIAEGWKYGLYNGVPTNFSAVFRQNHYGQFRDMLEQRIYTATYNNPEIGGPMDANGGIKFISGSSLAGESNNKLTSSIYAADNVTEAYRVNPYGSGIFDVLYRASQPWHADDTRPKYEFPRRVEV